MSNPTRETAFRGRRAVESLETEYGKEKFKTSMLLENIKVNCIPLQAKPAVLICMDEHPFSAFAKSLQRINRLAISNYAEWTNPFPEVPETKENMLDTWPTEKYVFAWWPQHLHSWEVLHRVGSSKEEKRVRVLFFSTQKVIYLKPKGVKDYLLNLLNWLQTSWRADFITLYYVIFKRMKEPLEAERWKLAFPWHIYSSD